MFISKILVKITILALLGVLCLHSPTEATFGGLGYRRWGMWGYPYGMYGMWGYPYGMWGYPWMMRYGGFGGFGMGGIGGFGGYGRRR